MKTFSTSGTGNQQTLSEIESDKIPVYDSVADAEADLANLEENQIVATKDKAVGELLHTVDIVEAGNMHPVTSNAVARSINKSITFTCPLSNGNYQNNQSIQIGNTVLLYCDVVITSGRLVTDSIILQGIPKVAGILRSISILVNDSNTIVGIGNIYANAGDTDMKLELSVPSISVGSSAFIKLSIKLIYQTD